MRLIAITAPGFRCNEAAQIERLLQHDGFWRVHVRKPGASPAAVARLISAIDPGLRPRLSVHDCFTLVERFPQIGIHLNSHAPEPPARWSGLVSRSCHSIAELNLPADYRFLSPIFNSISKPGYHAAFTLDELRGVVDSSVFALGGVTFASLPLLESVGFGGAAMLGAVWGDDSSLNSQ